VLLIVLPCSKMHENPANHVFYEGFEVLTAVVTNAAILWDIASCSPYESRLFGGRFLLHLQGLNSAAQ
jgi:hypothetical protein